MSRVVMFVLNDVSRDSRVLREAAALAEAGHSVTIVGRQGPDLEYVTREPRDGFEIMLVPFPADWPMAGPTGRPEAALRELLMLGPRVIRRARRDILDGTRAATHAVARALPALQRHIGLRRHLRRGRAVVAGASARARAARPIPLPPPAAGPATAVTAVAAARRAKPARRNPSNSTWMWLRQWRYGILRWAVAAAAAAPAADVWHGHDLSGLPAAIEASRRRGGRVVYDSHELFLESGAHVERAGWARLLMARLERRWARRADAVIAVNDAIGAELKRRYRLRRVVVIDNMPPRWQPPADQTDRLRAATGLSPATPIALYHGRFAPHRGLEQLADAILQPGLEHVHAVYLGYGQEQPIIETFMADSRFGGRIHLVPSVPPEELLDWLSTADLEVMAIQPSTLNHVLATGNKLFEAIAVGMPVVASDLPGKRLVLQGLGDGPLGELCDPKDIRDVARAMRAILSLSEEERAALRARCLRAARERWNWEVESARLVSLYAALAPPQLSTTQAPG